MVIPSSSWQECVNTAAETLNRTLSEQRFSVLVTLTSLRDGAKPYQIAHIQVCDRESGKSLSLTASEGAFLWELGPWREQTLHVETPQDWQRLADAIVQEGTLKAPVRYREQLAAAAEAAVSAPMLPLLRQERIRAVRQVCGEALYVFDRTGDVSALKKALTETLALLSDADLGE